MVAAVCTADTVTVATSTANPASCRSARGLMVGAGLGATTGTAATGGVGRVGGDRRRGRCAGAGADFVGSGRDTSDRGTTGVFGCWACLLGSRGTASGGDGGGFGCRRVDVDGWRRIGLLAARIVGAARRRRVPRRTGCWRAVGRLSWGTPAGLVGDGRVDGCSGSTPGFDAGFDAGFDFGFDPVSGLSVCWDVGLARRNRTPTLVGLGDATAAQRSGGEPRHARPRQARAASADTAPTGGANWDGGNSRTSQPPTRANGP